MGTFRHRIELAGRPEGPFAALDALVDTGATYTQVPRSLLEQMGVQPIDAETFVMADGSRIERQVGEVVVRLDGRTRTTLAIFGDEGPTPLLGAMTLEAFSMSADMLNRRLTRVLGYLTVAEQRSASRPRVVGMLREACISELH